MSSMKYLISGLGIIFLSSCFWVAPQTDKSIQSQDITTTKLSTATPIESLLTPTLPPSNTRIEFPSWMSDPETIIIAAYIRNDISQSLEIHFFNAATGEKFELTTPQDFGGFFWYDNMSFEIVSKNSNNKLKFDLQTGSISIDATPIKVPEDNYWKRKFSVTGQYSAELDTDDKIITVKDTKTGSVIWELNLPENRYGTELLWSPTNENQLAFLQGSPHISGKITEDMTLTIVDVVTDTTLSSYDGNFGVMEWSPNGKMILYLAPSFRYRNYGIPFQDAPCLLILTTSEKRCLRSIPHLIPEGYYLATTGNYSWGEDSNSIFYTYEYRVSTHYEVLGNLCNYSLVDSHINCPTQNLEVLHGNNVAFYDFSPDKTFIHICYSDSSLMSDASGKSNDGIIKIDGTGFFSWVGTIINGGPFESCSIETFWRPLP